MDDRRNERDRQRSAARTINNRGVSNKLKHLLISRSRETPIAARTARALCRNTTDTHSLDSFSPIHSVRPECWASLILSRLLGWYQASRAKADDASNPLRESRNFVLLIAPREINPTTINQLLLANLQRRLFKLVSRENPSEFVALLIAKHISTLPIFADL